MVARILVSVVGGGAITVAMLLGMHEVTKHWNDKDPTQYFTITDFIPAPPGSRRPSRPPAPEAPPETPRIGYDRSGGGQQRLPFEPPSADLERLESPPLVPTEPRLGDDGRN